jgi:hypothetical protein
VRTDTQCGTASVTLFHQTASIPRCRIHLFQRAPYGARLRPTLSSALIIGLRPDTSRINGRASGHAEHGHNFPIASCRSPRHSVSGCAAVELQQTTQALAALDRPDLDPEPAQRVSAAAPRTSPRYSWAELMMRVFDIDVLRCELCGSRRKLIAMITEPFVVRRILRHLGLEHEPPPTAAARPPPQGTFGYC